MRDRWNEMKLRRYALDGRAPSRVLLALLTLSPLLLATTIAAPDARAQVRRGVEEVPAGTRAVRHPGHEPGRRIPGQARHTGVKVRVRVLDVAAEPRGEGEAALRRTVQRFRSHVERCLMMTLGAERPPRGGERRDRFRVYLALEPNGRVRDVHLADDPWRDRRPGKCIRARARRWRFPPTSRRAVEVKVSYEAFVQRHQTDKPPIVRPGPGTKRPMRANVALQGYRGPATQPEQLDVVLEALRDAADRCLRARFGLGAASTRPVRVRVSLSRKGTLQGSVAVPRTKAGERRCMKAEVGASLNRARFRPETEGNATVDLQLGWKPVAVKHKIGEHPGLMPRGGAAP